MINPINNYDSINKFNTYENELTNLNQINRKKDKSFKTMLENAKDNIFNKQGKIDEKKLNKKQKKLFETCEDMESFFWKEMLDEMKKTINKYRLIDGGQGEKIFTDMLYDQYAKMMAKNADTGIATDMFKQLYKSI